MWDQMWDSDVGSDGQQQGLETLGTVHAAETDWEHGAFSACTHRGRDHGGNAMIWLSVHRHNAQAARTGTTHRQRAQAQRQGSAHRHNAQAASTGSSQASCAGTAPKTRTQAALKLRASTTPIGSVHRQRPSRGHRQHPGQAHKQCTRAAHVGSARRAVHVGQCT